MRRTILLIGGTFIAVAAILLLAWALTALLPQEAVLSFTAILQAAGAILLTVVAAYALQSSSRAADASEEHVRLARQERREATVDAFLELLQRIETNMADDNWLTSIDTAWREWQQVYYHHRRRLHHSEAEDRLNRFHQLLRDAWSEVGPILSVGAEKARQQRQIEGCLDIPFPPALRNRVRAAAVDLREDLVAMDARKPLPPCRLPDPTQTRTYLLADPGEEVDAYL